LKKIFDNPVFKFISSIKLALPMILWFRFLLASGTIVESALSTAVAKRCLHTVVQSGPSASGDNVFCSAIPVSLEKTPNRFCHHPSGYSHYLALLNHPTIRMDGTDRAGRGPRGHIFQEINRLSITRSTRMRLSKSPPLIHSASPRRNKPQIIHLPMTAS